VTAAPAPAALAGLDITEPGFFLRPDYWDALAWLRAESPVHDLGDGHVLVTRHDDIRAVSRRPDRFSSRHGALVNDPLRRSGPDDDAGSLLHLDPPRHAEHRALLNRRFTPRAVEGFAAGIRARTVEVLDALADEAASGAEVDLVARLAAPVPVAVIADLLAVPVADRAQFRRWSDAVIDISDRPDDPAVAAAAAELFAFLDAHVRGRARAPGDDLASQLAASQVGGRGLTHDQVVMFCVTLLVAGNETTRSLVSGAIDVLAAHPDQRAALAADRGLTPGAVEESLRWVTPIQAFCRTVTAPTEVGGTPVAAGAYLVLLYASGNRDEAAFGPTAGSFDITRPASPAHVAFGFGEHLCLGAALARLEARVVLDELLARHPRYVVTGPPVYTPSTLTRSIAVLPVVLAGD
jgi:cytochrome P450